MTCTRTWYLYRVDRRSSSFQALHTCERALPEDLPVEGSVTRQRAAGKRLGAKSAVGSPSAHHTNCRRGERSLGSVTAQPAGLRIGEERASTAAGEPEHVEEHSELGTRHGGQHIADSGLTGL